MSRPKVKKPKDKVVLTQGDIQRMKVEISHRTLLLVTAWTMDELDYDEDRIIEMWNGISRWSEAIDEKKLIKLNDIANIINDKTGLNLRW